MLIAFLLAAWFVWAAVFVLGLCRAAARPMPWPEVMAGSDEENHHPYHLYETVARK
jgi:hypothetical protein